MNSSSPESPRPILIVFARNPVPGRVKTRLIPHLGADGACRLHRQLLQRTLETAQQNQDHRLELWLDTSEPDPAIRELNPGNPFPIRTQQGNDLGQRMYHAISDALLRSSRVVLIGSDCPDWQPGDFIEAFVHLNEYDAVVAPATDGGYVLIGCRKIGLELFSGISWGTNQVFAETRRRLDTLGWRWHQLPTHHDIDTRQDLKLVPELL